ncbi:MAG: DNA mismatch repair endonuclease MutL [Brevinema sp.]
MSIIKILDSATAMKIAAGEVIDRPASAVRELLDNALDAQATWICVQAEKGGKEFLSVQDNGIGMLPEDLKKCYLNHATSKIQYFNDLSQLKTFGFRGEALASLAEIACVQIASCPIDQEFGSVISINFGKEQNIAPKGMNQGTQVHITNFFQNVPARLKFLSTDVAEYRSIIQEFLKKALAKPEVHFELIHNGEKKYQLTACSELFVRITDIFPELADVLQAFVYEENGIQVYGFLSHPAWYKNTRNCQYFFVNGRMIEWQIFRQQIAVVYNSLLPPSKFPAVFCYVKIDTEKIDFNVHPQKREIRFENEQMVASVVRRAMRKGLEQMDFLKEIYFGVEKIESSQPVSPKLTSSMKSYPPLSFPSFRSSSSSSMFFSKVSVQEEQLKILFQKEQTPIHQFLSARYMGTVFQSYLIFDDQENLYLVDFHAMHERIRYEKILEYYQQSVPSQKIIPILFEISKQEAEIFEQIEVRLTQLGFILSPISETAFSVEGIPSMLTVGSIDTVLRELFVEDLSLQDSYYWDSLCKMIACKGSSRSGDSLSYEEVQSLIEEWNICKNPHTCPHGRPIVISMNKLFFDKEFKRTGF